MAATGLQVRLRQGRERAEVSRFTGTLDEIVRALREIDRVYRVHGTRITWVLEHVEHQGDELVVRLEPRRVPSDRDVADMMVPVEALVDGAEMLQERPTVPEFFSPTTVMRLAKLATPTVGVLGVSLATYNGTSGVPIELDTAVKDNATAAVNPTVFAYGSVTGTLSGLQQRQRRQGGVSVTVRPDLDRRGVTGFVPESQAEQLQLRQLWRHRVLLRGIIKRNASGQAIHIDVDGIERMPDDDTGRPSASALLGAAEGWLGDMTVDEYITQLRDDG